MRINGANITANFDNGILPDLALNGGDPKSNWKTIKNLRKNAKVPAAAGTWEEIDEEVIRAYEQEAKVIQDLRDMGLTANHDLGNLFSSYRVSSLMQDAEIDMSGETMGDEDRIEYKTNTVPVPVIHKEFRIGWRENANSDTSADNIAEATRSVTRALEALAWGGANWTVEGNAISGIKDVEVSGTWGDAGAWSTAENSYSETMQAIENLRDLGYGPPYNLYVDDAHMVDLMGLRSNTTKNYVEVLESHEDINAVRFTDNAADHKAYLISMTRRSVDLAVSQWITPVNWSKGPDGRVTQYQVFAVAIPRLKTDYAGNSGVQTNSGIN